MNIFHKEHGQERGQSEIEQKLKITFDPCKKDEDLAAQGATFMEIFFADGTQLTGIYRGTTKSGYHVICPASFPNGKKLNPTDPHKSAYDWHDQPNCINAPIKGFRPVPKSFLEAYAEGFDKVQGLGSYF